MVRKIILILFLQLFCLLGYSQYSSNQHSKLLSITNDSIQLDTLSLVPGSIILTATNGTLLDTSYYKVNYADGILVVKQQKLIDNNIDLNTIKVSYQTFPYLFSQEVKHKDSKLIKPDLFGNINPFTYNASPQENDIFYMEHLDKSGSISRGISFGNSQDMSVNSNLDLQLSGHLNNNIDILLSATDSNIPIQPDGNTQQLQEFDKVFIQVSNPTTKLIAGDFQLTRPTSYFMNFHKKAQGLSFSTALKTNKNKKDIKKQGVYKTTVSAAVSRGKFSRNEIVGVEANQGPYRLVGAENERFIIVLSGTEKVYINGKLLDRGQENDYVIDYNTSEITFTAKQIITKDKRIVVQFQYSDKVYARSLVHFGNDYEQDKLKLHLNVYSEQDSKNQPLQQDLSSEQKKVMADVGDSLSLAVYPSYDSVAFSNSEVLYKLMDTIIGSNIYRIFKYNTDSTQASYRVSYNSVGQGKGNYVQINSSANGKVFEWVMPDPLTSVPNGNYEPVTLLITPKQKQMITVGLDYDISTNTKLSIETSLSNNDINTFSTNNSGDDVGYGLKMSLDNSKPLFTDDLSDTTSDLFRLSTNANIEFVQKNFSPIQRYRNIEFERDWNRASNEIVDNQQILGAGLTLSKNSLGDLGYKINTFFEGANYLAFKHLVHTDVGGKGFRVRYDGSLLSSESATNTSFYRHKSNVSQNIKWLTLGIKDEFEQNKFILPKQDSLLSNSYKFWEWQAYMQNADTTKNKYGINYMQRTDYKAKSILGSTDLNKASLGENYGAFLELNKNPKHRFKINGTYRELKIIDSTIINIQPEKTLLSRVEYDFKLLKGLVNSNSYYEIGSGLEIKKEFSYLQVPTGQGIYTWNDYNDNGIKELNEFEVTTLKDKQEYIKVYTPTQEYIKVFSNQFSEMLILKPSAVWANKKGMRQFVSRFSNQSTYRVDRKSTDADLSKSYNPFYTQTDSSNVTLNSSFRNTLYINRLGSVFAVDLTFQDLRGLVLLTNGIDTRKNRFKEARLRWNMTKQFFWNVNYKEGRKSFGSQFFTSRDYSIYYREAEPKLSYQPNTSFRATVSFKYTDKQNDPNLGSEQTNMLNYGAAIKYNVLQKGSLNLKGNFIEIKYNGEENTSIGFEMLEALQIGRNITWGLTYQRNLSNNMQLSLNYDGRQSEGGKAIHTGGAQIRAYF